jgi:Fe-S-cluster containining protein
MTFCDTCDIHEKLMLCCGKHPVTGDHARLELSDGIVVACPHLTTGGRCSIYGKRPHGCKKFFCENYMTDRSLLRPGENGIIEKFHAIYYRNN